MPIITPIKSRKRLNKLPVTDLRAIAKFNRIVKNYMMMDRALSEGNDNKGRI